MPGLDFAHAGDKSDISHDERECFAWCGYMIKWPISDTVAWMFLFRAFDVDMLYIAQFLNIPTVEVAIAWQEIEGKYSSQYEPAHKNRGGFPICGSSRAQSPIWATDICFYLKLPQDLYYTSANSKALVKLHLCAGSPEPLLAAYVISTDFSCWFRYDVWNWVSG